MHPKYTTTYRVGNWAEYDRALVRRGDVTLWLTPDAIATWAAAGVGRRSGQLQYSDLAIETALTLSLIFHVPLRQTEGFLTSIFGMLGVDLTAPDHTTLSRRGQHLALALRRARPGTSLHLIVDSTGLSIVGEGEWAAAKHGGRARRGWRKLHLGVDGSRVIVAYALTEPTADDAGRTMGGRFESVAKKPARDSASGLRRNSARRFVDGDGHHLVSPLALFSIFKLSARGPRRYLMGYLTMCALSARARRCGSCVLPSPCPRGDLSTWCVERAIAAATLQGVPGARPGDCVVGLLCMVMQPPEPVATDQAGRRRAHAASWLPRLRHRRGQAPGPHACGASTGRLIADALCPPDPRRSGTVSHDRTAMRCRAADLGWPVSQWCHQATLEPHGWLTEDEVTRKRRERSRTMWASEDELPEPRTEGRAIDPAAVERMFDATRGAHVSPGELEQIWCGQPGPPADRSWPDPAGAWYCTGIDWAQKRDSTVAAVVRCDTTPLQLVAVYRAQRRPWLSMTAQVGALLDEYPGTAAHDATGAGNAMGAFPALAAHDQLQGVTPVGRVRTDLFRHDSGAIERHEIVCPRIDVFYTEHLYCGEDDLFGSGHPPETVVALALAYHAFQTGQRPS